MKVMGGPLDGRDVVVPLEAYDITTAAQPCRYWEMPGRRGVMYRFHEGDLVYLNPLVPVKR